MSAGTERACCQALLCLLARCALATASAAASAVNGRWFILALLMKLSPLLLLEHGTTLKSKGPLKTLGWNLFGSYCCQQSPQTEPNTLLKKELLELSRGLDFWSSWMSLPGTRPCGLYQNLSVCSRIEALTLREKLRYSPPKITRTLEPRFGGLHLGPAKSGNSSSAFWSSSPTLPWAQALGDTWSSIWHSVAHGITQEPTHFSNCPQPV